MLTDSSSGNELDTTLRGLKLRLSTVFKSPGQSMTSMMAELRTLTPKDEDDFRDWFNAAGYPVN